MGPATQLQELLCMTGFFLAEAGWQPGVGGGSAQLPALKRFTEIGRRHSHRMSVRWCSDCIVPIRGGVAGDRWLTVKGTFSNIEVIQHVRGTLFQGESWSQRRQLSGVQNLSLTCCDVRAWHWMLAVPHLTGRPVPPLPLLQVPVCTMLQPG